MEQHISNLDVSATPRTMDIGQSNDYVYKTTSRDSEINIESVHPTLVRDVIVDQVRSEKRDRTTSADSQVHNHHNEAQSYQEAHSGHSHGNLNMRGVSPRSL
jgi:hypothetical protein